MNAVVSNLVASRLDYVLEFKLGQYVVTVGDCSIKLKDLDDEGIKDFLLKRVSTRSDYYKNHAPRLCGFLLPLKCNGSQLTAADNKICASFDCALADLMEAFARAVGTTGIS